MLDMGEPVKILDVAREFCRLKGFEPGVDIPIVYSGLRPGERMYENLHYEAEDVVPTQHSRVMRATGEDILEDPQGFLERLQTIVAARDPKAVQELLASTFPSYREAVEAQEKTQSS